MTFEFVITVLLSVIAIAMCLVIIVLTLILKEQRQSNATVNNYYNSITPEGPQ